MFYLKNTLLVLFVLFSTFTIADQQPLDSFTRHGDYLDMKLSPDGKHIAARIRFDGRVGFLVLNTGTMKPVGGLRANSGDEIHSVEWINSERLVYQYAEKSSRFDQPVATGELFAVNYDNSKSTTLFGYRAGEKSTGTRLKVREETLASAEIISYLPEEKSKILIAEYPFTVTGSTYYITRENEPVISELDVYSGRKRKVDYIPYKWARIFASDSGEINFVRYTDANFTTQAAYRASKDDEWQDLSDTLGSDLTPLGISNDGSKVYLQGNIGDKNLQTMFEFELASKTLKPLFEGMSTDIERFVWDNQLQQPVVGISYPDKHKYHYTEQKSKTASLQKAFAASFAGQEVLIESESQDGKYVLLHVSGDVNPGEYYLYDTEAKEASFLWANRSWLDPRTLAPTQHFAFTTSDSQKVNGYVTMPTNAEAGVKVPFVTMIHGGPHGIRDYASFNSEVQLLANRGYAVVQINFRGSGGYGASFEQAGYRQWGGNMINDILEGSTAAIEQFPLDADKACVYGASYGGYAAMMSSIRAPEMFKCVVGYVGLYNLNYFFTESDTAEAYGGLGYLKRLLGTNQQALDENSPVNHADKIQANVMIIHGEKDARVPVINAEAMIAALNKVGNEPKYLNFSRSGHGVFDEAGRKQLYQALVEFLDANIK